MIQCSFHDKILKLNKTESWDYFSELCENPEDVQKKVLQHIITESANSHFGIGHDFADIADSDDFRKKVPISEWKDYSEASIAMQKGEKNILFPGKPLFFIMTSGTSGIRKLLPETQNGSKAKAATDKIRSGFSFGAFPEIMQGKILPLVNSADLGATECGIPFGTASGITMKNMPKSILDRCAFPPDILKTVNPDSLDYLVMRFAINENVSMIIGNNAARMEKLAHTAKINALQICEDIKNGTISDCIDIDPVLRKKLTEKLFPDPGRADFLKHILISEKEFIPSAYWPDLKVICCWLSGTVGSSVSSIKDIFSRNTVFLDYGYGASEGKFNIPHIAGSPSGPLALHAAFYEFLPADTADNADSAENTCHTLMAHQLEKGGVYKLIITNFSGLYRYDMHDLIQVTGFYKNTPEIVFISKTGDIGNIAGEKLSGSTVCDASAEAAIQAGIKLKHICAVPVENPPHYIFCIEPADKNTVIPVNFAETLDKEIRKDLGYGNKRRDNLIAKPELQVMKPGWLEAIYKEKTSTGLSRTQLKLPVIYKNIPCENFCD